MKRFKQRKALGFLVIGAVAAAALCHELWLPGELIPLFKIAAAAVLMSASALLCVAGGMERKLPKKTIRLHILAIWAMMAFIYIMAERRPMP